jgi:hypothetical protein
MPAIETPQTATASEAEADDTLNNPAQTWQHNVMHITLKFDGVSPDPSAIYDMLNTQFGTVATEKGAGGNNRGTYIYKISA